MTGQIIGTLFGIIGTVLSAVILGVIKSGQSKAKRREEDQEHRWQLVITSLRSSLSMNEVMCRCITGDAHNGDLEEAKQNMARAKRDLNEYLDHKAAKID